MRITKILSALLWLLPPSIFKNRCLNFCGNQIADEAILMPNFVWNSKVNCAPSARIGLFNVVRNVKVLDLSDYCEIGVRNTISAHPIYASKFHGAGTVIMEEASKMTNRHKIDCSGSVELGAYSLLAGANTSVLTHQIDLVTNEQTISKVVIGERTFVSTNCVLLKGATVPAFYTVAAGAVVTAGLKPHSVSGMYGGVPAKLVRKHDLTSNGWHLRSSVDSVGIRCDGDMSD